MSVLEGTKDRKTMELLPSDPHHQHHYYHHFHYSNNILTLIFLCATFA